MYLSTIGEPHYKHSIANRYDGTSIVERSIELDEPVIYVSMNYRVTGQYESNVLLRY